MYRRKNNVIYVDFLFKRKKIKSKIMILFYYLSSKLRKAFLRSDPNKFYKKPTLSNNQRKSNY